MLLNSWSVTSYLDISPTLVENAHILMLIFQIFSAVGRFAFSVSARLPEHVVLRYSCDVLQADRDKNSTRDAPSPIFRNDTFPHEPLHSQGHAADMHNPSTSVIYSK